MANESRTVVYDADIKVEAYHFQGIMQKFPNHFHDYYVIGFVESGSRYLTCLNRDYTIHPGDLMLFNPRDNHACEQIDGSPLDYRSLNIQPEAMTEAVREITGQSYLPVFKPQVVFHNELVPILKDLHRIIMAGEQDFRKEELYLLLLEQLIQEYSEPREAMPSAPCSAEIEMVCSYLESHYTETIALDDLSALTGLSKYYLIRQFSKQKGISPYSYLETIRVDKAKKLLEQGVSPMEAAMGTGFSDQSHFSNFFKKFIGLTPKQYMNIFNDHR
ncbi:AraC family ligand binding domain-containing protein [Paenibacillus sp. CAU 1782]